MFKILWSNEVNFYSVSHIRSVSGDEKFFLIVKSAPVCCSIDSLNLYGSVANFVGSFCHDFFILC